MPDRNRARTTLIVLASALAGGLLAAGGALLLLQVFTTFAEPLGVRLTPAIRYTVVALAVTGMVPLTAGSALRARRPSTDFLQRR